MATKGGHNSGLWPLYMYNGQLCVISTILYTYVGHRIVSHSIRINQVYSGQNTILGHRTHNISFHTYSHIKRPLKKKTTVKCGENRNHGKFKIYFLNILSDYRFKSCQTLSYITLHFWLILFINSLSNPIGLGFLLQQQQVVFHFQFHKQSV